MTYELGTATSPSDLLQKLAVFIAANGWTIDSSVSEGAGWRLHAHRGSVYLNTRASVNEAASASQFANYYTTPYSGIAIYLGTGYSGASSWRDQAGGPKNFTTPANTVGAGMSLPQGAISQYHFFADATGDNIIAVVEKTAGVFTHIFWGTSLEKLGTWTGGPYFGGALQGYYLGYTSASPGTTLSARCPGAFVAGGSQTYVRIDVDTFTGKWVGLDSGLVGYQGYTGKIGCCCAVEGVSTNSLAPSYRYYLSRITNQMSGQSLLLPVRFLVSRDAGGMSFIGALPNILVANACAKGFTPGALYAWGTDNYRVFPGPSSFPNIGYAIKQV